MVLNHEGRWAAEEMLDLEWPQIMFRYNNGGAGTRIQAAIIYALTRKHHGRELPDSRATMRLLDKIDDAPEDEVLDFTFALTAAISGVTKKEVKRDYEERMAAKRGDDSEAEPARDEEDEEGSGDPKGEDEDEGSERAKTTKRPSRSRTGSTGKSSS